MREALAARSDRDFVVAAPARRGPAKGRKKEGLGAQALAFAWRYPLEIAISIALAGAACAIVWNALALQTARHPAPLFSPKGGKPEIAAPLPLPPMRPVSPYMPANPVPQASPQSAPAPLPAAPLPPRPAPRDSIGDLIRSGEVPSSRSAPVAPAKLAPARDGIGDLIRHGEPAPVPPGYVGKPEPTRLVASGQRALSKLGYGSIEADGVMGPTTRQAVERFERDRRLPVTGEISGRTARELAAQAGIPVE